jgi:hypothetical protein
MFRYQNQKKYALRPDEHPNRASPFFLQANSATSNALIGPTAKAARNVATVRTEAIVTTFQELVLVRLDGEELCKLLFIMRYNTILL